MKNNKTNFIKYYITFKLLAIIVIASNFLYAQLLNNKSDIYKQMALVNDYWITGHTNPGDNKWANSVYHIGNMETYMVGRIPMNTNYFYYSFNWAQLKSWSILNPTVPHADNQACGQVYIHLSKNKSISADLSKLKANLDIQINRTKVDDWWWCDAMFMAMPVFTNIGIIYNDNKYFDKMYELYSDSKTRRKLYDTTECLFFRDEAYLYPQFTTPSGKKCFWSRGNGWVFAAHAKVLESLPKSDLHYNEYLSTFINMAKALKPLQRSDGFWNVSLIDSTHYGGPETSGTSFFVYGMAWGINNGILDSAEYYSVIEKGWNGLVNIAVHPNGFLGYVQGVGKEPANNQPVGYNNTADFGVGAFLLAGSEICKFAISKDDVLPTMPTNLTVNDITANSIKLSWQQSTDNIGIDEYCIYVDGVLRWTTSNTYITLNNLAPGQQYNITIKAIDKNDNMSIESDNLIIRTKSLPDFTLNNVRVVPNPFNAINNNNKITFYKLTPLCTIRIFTESGELVKTIEHTSCNGEEQWDLKTESSNLVVSGMYIANISDKKGQSKNVKFIIIR